MAAHFVTLVTSVRTVDLAVALVIVVDTAVAIVTLTQPMKQIWEQ